MQGSFDFVKRMRTGEEEKRVIKNERGGGTGGGLVELKLCVRQRGRMRAERRRMKKKRSRRATSISTYESERGRISRNATMRRGSSRGVGEEVEEEEIFLRQNSKIQTERSTFFSLQPRAMWVQPSGVEFCHQR